MTQIKWTPEDVINRVREAMQPASPEKPKTAPRSGALQKILGKARARLGGETAIPTMPGEGQEIVPR